MRARAGVRCRSVSWAQGGRSGGAGGGGSGARGSGLGRWLRGEVARSAMAETIADTRRLISKPQNLNDAYGPPSNFLEIDVGNPQTVGVGRGRFTTYEIRVKVSRPGSGVAVSGSRVTRGWPGWR